MANGLGSRGLIAAAGVALVFAAASAAQAQFMAPGGFPVIAIPPPPAQTIVIPRRPAPDQVSQPSQPSGQPQIRCEYHGQTRVCEEPR